MEVEDDVVDWLELPDHLCFEIIGMFTCCSDYVRFASVCVSWRSLILNEVECPKLPPQLPMLIIPEKDEDEKKRNTGIIRSCNFYRITDKQFYKGLQIRMPCYRQFYGSGHGWVVTLDKDESSDHPIQLINPFYFPDHKVIQLPPLVTFPFEEDDENHSLLKVVLSADPISSPNDYMVLAIYGEYCELALFKSGDQAWAPIVYEKRKVFSPIVYEKPKAFFQDVIYYRDQFYAVDYFGAVVVCDLATYMAKRVIQPPANVIKLTIKYLVESAGELLQVHRVFVYDEDPGIVSTKSFKVLKLLLDPNKKEEPDWVEVKDLCGHALFLGDNYSMSISASHFPGCKPNCIYYTYYIFPESSPHDLGIFNLESGSFEKYYPTDIHTPIQPAPIWIEPTPIWNIRVNANSY